MIELRERFMGEIIRSEKRRRLGGMSLLIGLFILVGKLFYYAFLFLLPIFLVKFMDVEHLFGDKIIFVYIFLYAFLIRLLISNPSAWTFRDDWPRQP